MTRLVTENETLRVKLVENQREFEERESELISEINVLVTSLNNNAAQQDGADANQEEAE